MRAILIILLAGAPALAACSDGSASPTGSELTPRDPLPRTSGSFASRYRVPTDPSLANAASYSGDSVEWTVVGDAVTLHYNLPDGLVGGKVPVTLTGSIEGDGSTVLLAGPAGTGTCVATGTSITCHEVFGDLGPLPISMEVVERVAARDYAGPIADRVNVAIVFGSDPIGFVDIDVATPVVDDHGGGN